MEANTVLLRIEEYNELIDIRRGIQDSDKTVLLNIFCEGDYYVLTDSKAVEMLARENQTCLKIIKSLKRKISELKNPTKKHLSIEEIKAMNWWQFRKWKTGKL